MAFLQCQCRRQEEYCLYADHKVYDVAIDLLFEKVSEDQYRLRIFRRGNGSKKNLVGLDGLLDRFSPEENDGRMVSKPMSAKEILDFINVKQGEIQRLIDDSNAD